MGKKKKWSRNQKLALLGIVVMVILFFAAPIRDDIYKFGKSKSYMVLKEKYKTLLKTFSDKTSILAVRPLAFVPYIPKYPQVPGQKKALIVAEIKIKNKRLANNVRVKFDIDDGAGRRVDSETWNAIAKQQSLLFSMFYPDTKFVSWSPDIPNAIENIAKNRENPFKLWLSVSWEDADKKEHRLESYSELRYSETLNQYYFDERANVFLF